MRKFLMISLCVFIHLCASAQKGGFVHMPNVKVTEQGTTKDGLKYRVVNDKVTITDWKPDNRKNVVIPDNINGFPVETIGQMTSKKIKSIVLSKNIKNIYNSYWNPTKIVKIPFELAPTATFEFGNFGGWYLAHGKRAGTYTYKNNMWYLDGSPPPPYATILNKGGNEDAKFYISFIDSQDPSRFSLGNDRIFLSPGHHTILFNIPNLQDPPGTYKRFSADVFVEAGKTYEATVTFVGRKDFKEGLTSWFTITDAVFVINEVKK